MARRSSARLRARESQTPQRVSLSHDAPLKVPRTAPHKLASLQESDEMPGAFPRSPSPISRLSLTATRRASTPTDSTPIKPSDAEMHPQLHHKSTAKALDEARHLGFSNMVPQTEPPKHSSKLATMQGTPTRASQVGVKSKSPNFEFTFRREQSLELSPDAKRLMSEMRQEAARIREQMIANGEGLETGNAEGIAGRKIAQPKGKSGRFSDVHKNQFQKMDSIAGHASSFRAQKTLTVTTPSMQQSEKRGLEQAKSLKRSPSKAELDQQDKTSSGLLRRSPSKPTLNQTTSHLPRSTTLPNLTSTSAAPSSPSKRVKRSEKDDVSATRHSASDDEKPLPATPQTNKSLRVLPHLSTLAKLSSPTQASLARTGSVKAARSTAIPAPKFTPSKPLFTESGKVTTGPLLSRSPSKAALFPRSTTQATNDATEASTQLLSQSPLRSSVKKPSFLEKETSKPSETPLLNRSPMKMSIAKSEDAHSKAAEKPQGTPLLSRSPSKIPMPEAQDDAEGAKSPGRSHSKGLMGRLNLLRASPMKSILRSPQRLYSDDPAKVAAGTHLATPPKFKERSIFNSKPPATAPAQKRVDFSSSVKARFEEREASCTPSKAPTPPAKVLVTEPQTEPRRSIVDYPSLPGFADPGSPSPQKRRETVGPLDFTFRAGSQRIIFSQSPGSPNKEGQPARRATIRHVSSDFNVAPAAPPAAGSKKRKFDFENIAPAVEAGSENKENDGAVVDEDDDENRPAKRVKSNTTSAPVVKKGLLDSRAAQASRRPTLGVKPKGTKTIKDTKTVKDKRPSTISQARLNALSQPKRRA